MQGLKIHMIRICFRIPGEGQLGEQSLLLVLRPDGISFADHLMSVPFGFICEVSVAIFASKLKDMCVSYHLLHFRERFEEAFR